MGKESQVEIPEGSGRFYRYEYDPDTQETQYRGPVGSAPNLSEEEFLAHIPGASMVTPSQMKWRRAVLEKAVKQEKKPVFSIVNERRGTQTWGLITKFRGRHYSAKRDDQKEPGEKSQMVELFGEYNFDTGQLEGGWLTNAFREGDVMVISNWDNLEPEVLFAIRPILEGNDTIGETIQRHPDFVLVGEVKGGEPGQDIEGVSQADLDRFQYVLDFRY
jgi:hypothetical protein